MSARYSLVNSVHNYCLELVDSKPYHGIVLNYEKVFLMKVNIKILQYIVIFT